MVDVQPATVVYGPLQDLGDIEEYPNALAARIVSLFDLPAPVEAHDFPDKGNINRQTFLILSGRPGSTREYLLQRINQQVFTRPWSVMKAMVAAVEAQRESLSEGLLPQGREWDTIELIPTRNGARFLECNNRRGATYWRLMGKIPECRTYKSLSELGDKERQLAVAEEAGRGLAIYGDLTSRMDISGLVSPLPGYRDTRLYYDQFVSVLRGNRTEEQADSLLPRDDVLRESTKEHFLVHLPPVEYDRRRKDPDLRRFVDLAQREHDYATMLLRGMATGAIRTLAIHGDTKLDNFLFSTRTGQVKALVDLDTIMPHTWLADWGDMVRSLANVAGEKERDLNRVQVDRGIYEAVTRGFLGTARGVTPAEIDLMADAVQVIALELGVRFLTDYVRGDNYFKLGPADSPDLNKVRAMVQLTLFERLRDNADTLRSCVEAFSAGRSGCGN